MRKAYIGLSSPTAYYYDHDREHFNEPWRWNPILESPQGLITLFDELWFLSRALCPVSLRKEKFVKFIDEDSDYQPLIKSLAAILINNDQEGLIANNPSIENFIDLESDYSSEQFKRYNKVIKNIYGSGPSSQDPIDNHSHSIDLCGYGISGNSMRLDLIVFDIAFLTNAGISNIEFITNSFNSAAFKTKPKTIDILQISQGITIKRIPALQTPKGPVIEKIESIRESNFLIDFREKILLSKNPENFADLIIEIENEFNKYRNSVLIEKQKGSRIINSIGKNALSLVIGAIIPAAGEVTSLIKDVSARKFNWTGFLAEIENSV